MKISRETVDEIIKHHLGKVPKEVIPMAGGHSNFVFEAVLANERYIVRISDNQAKLQYFIKEQWAVEKAREKKVPVAEILEVGNEASKFPYMIVRKVEGARAEYHEKRLEAIKDMGKYAAIINSIPTSGYGHIFDWSSNQLSRKDSWKDFLENELKIWDILTTFEKHNIFSDGHNGLTKLKSALKELIAWDHKPTLCHGDLRPKNIIINEKGKINAILDWETCSSSIAPQWDLSITLDDLMTHEKDIFLDAYGLSPQEYRNRARGVKVLNILRYGPHIERVYREFEDPKRKDLIDVFRNRLRGALDLYSL